MNKEEKKEYIEEFISQFSCRLINSHEQDNLLREYLKKMNVSTLSALKCSLIVVSGFSDIMINGNCDCWKTVTSMQIVEKVYIYVSILTKALHDINYDYIVKEENEALFNLIKNFMNRHNHF